MRAGSVLLLLVLIVMGFGFLLSSNLYIQQDLTTAQQQLDEITKGKKVIEDQLNQATAEIAKLNHQNEVLSQEKLLLVVQVKQIQGEYSSVKDQNTQLQAQINKMSKVNSLISDLTNFSPKSLVLALFIPLLPISLASSFLLYRKGKLHTTRKNIKSNRVFSMQVTDEEMKLIRQMRRNQ